MTKVFIRFLVFVFVLAGVRAFAQTATGIISGTVSDNTGAIVPNAMIAITDKATGAVRNVTSSDAGFFSAPDLTAGQYRVHIAMQGFKTTEADAEVQAGGSTTVNLQLTIGSVNEVVEVSAAAPQMNYDSHSISGVVEYQSITNLPLNGRSFVQLASLQPGVQVVAQSQGLRNAPLGITILGGGGQYPLVTVDGLQINDFNDGNAGAGTAINFSQEVIQEFQLSSANFDLSTFTTMQGAVNMVTRSGSNDFHGAAYMFYRDRNMAAYPGYRFNPANPNPYFVRKNPGFTLSGPVVKDKLFFFGSYEYTSQIAAVAVLPDLASIRALQSIYSSPNAYNYTTIRLDDRQSDKSSIFLRWTHDSNNGFGLGGSASFPSNWVSNYNWSEQYALGVTTAVTSNFVNDFRLGFRDWTNRDNATTTGQCPGSCIGGPVPGLAPNGLPNLSMVGSSNFGAGSYSLTPQSRVSRNLEPLDIMSLQKKTHRLQFGGGMDYYEESFYYPICLRGCMSIYSLENTQSILGPNLATYAPQLVGKSTISNTTDLLNLPISYPTASLIGGFEVGPGQTPGAYHFYSERRNFRPRIFFQDFWKAKPNLTINFGLAYAYESGLWPSDMPIPGLEGPIYGLPAQTQHLPTPTEKFNITPAAGFTYSPGTSGKWIIRGGAGIYYDTGNYVQKLHTIANIGPVGNGPISLPSNVFTIPTIAQDPNPAYDHIVVQGPNGTFPALPRGGQVPTTQFTNLTLGQFMEIYNDEYPSISAMATPATPVKGGSYQYSNMDLIKQATVLTNIKNPMPRSYQTSIGVQRDMGHDFVVSADWVRRQVQHNSLGQVDLNHFTEYVNGVQTPAVAKCTNAQLFVLNQQCSTGGFSTYLNEGTAMYEGLLVRGNKRFSHHYSLIVSYAFQNLSSETVVNLNDYSQGYGPTLAHHNLNVAGIVNLPWGFELALNSSFISRTPVEIVTTSVDLSGTGAASGGGPLPGLPVRGLPSKATVAKAVDAFNTQYAGTHTPNGTTIVPYVLPANGYELGRPTDSQDIRITKVFTVKDRYKLSLYGEVFNSLNIANLTGYGFNLDKQATPGTAQSAAFGQATARAGQVFLSSGPRAEQIGARISF